MGACPDPGASARRPPAVLPGFRVLLSHFGAGSLACSYTMLGIDLDEAWLWSQSQHEDLFVDTSYFPTNISVLPGRALTFSPLKP